MLLGAVCFGWQAGGVAPANEIFSDVTERAGIQWRHFSGQSEDRFLIEASCGGAGFVDFDNDGLLDIFLVNGGETPRGKSRLPVRNALYRNLGGGKFEDVAVRAGVDRLRFFGMGVSAADYDNDGYQDLYVTGYPSSALFHNNGDGTFEDVTERAGVGNSGEWAASAAWFDYDRDGLLDVFVTNYAEMSFGGGPRCEYQGEPVYCAQLAYKGRAPRLFRNNGHGTFSDVSKASGVLQHEGRGFGVVAIDVDDDGWSDLFVARDASPNLLLINQRDGTFRDRGLDAEVAYSSDGGARAGMGIDAGDVDANGFPDFAVTNFNGEYHALYLNPGKLPFVERTLQSGLAAMSWPYVGWGTRFIDYDNDGRLDLVIVNGHLNHLVERAQVDVQYRQPPLLLANEGKGIFRNVKENAGTIFRTPYLARALASGDFDNDGDSDILFSVLDGKPVLAANRVGQNVTWLGLELQGTQSNRDAIGAKITVRAGGQNYVRWIAGGGSFLASQDRRLLIGLGSLKPAPESVSVEIRWPNGVTQQVSGLQPRKYHRIVEAARKR